MASGAWGWSSAWGNTQTPVNIPSFEEVMKEQENEKTDERNIKTDSSKRNAEAWLASGPWYPGKVDRNKRRKQAEVKGHEGQSHQNASDSVQMTVPSGSFPADRTAKSDITVVNVHLKDLNNSGYKDLVEWLKNPDHLYIGRDMTRFVPGAVGSKWQNPFKSKQIGRENSVKKYREHILTDKTVQSNGKTLFESLHELKGKSLGCWCHPERCHGHILRELVEQYCT